MNLFEFILFGVFSDFCIFAFSFAKCGVFYIILIFFQPHYFSPLSSSEIPEWHECWILFLVPRNLFIFPIYFLSFSDWVIFINFSWSSLNLCAGIFTVESIKQVLNFWYTFQLENFHLILFHSFYFFPEIFDFFICFKRICYCLLKFCCYCYG